MKRIITQTKCHANRTPKCNFHNKLEEEKFFESTPPVKKEQAVT